MGATEPSNLRLAFNADAQREPAARELDPGLEAAIGDDRSRVTSDAIKEAIQRYEQSMRTAVSDEARSRIERELVAPPARAETTAQPTARREPSTAPTAAPAHPGAVPNLDAAEAELAQAAEARVRAEVGAARAALERAAAEASARAAAQTRAEAETAARALAESLAQAEQAAAHEARERSRAQCEALE